MSQIPSTASPSSSPFHTIFNASIIEYQKKTKKDLLKHPLMAQLQPCNSPIDILAVLRAQVHQFEQSTSGDDKWTKWLNPTVNVLLTLSAVLGEGVGLVSFVQANLPSSYIIFLGVLACESDFRWCRCPPFSCDRPTFPLLGFF